MKNLKKFLTMLLAAVMCFNVTIPLSAQNVGDRLGYVLNTDIRVFINGEQIMGYNIDGHTYVVAEDLAAYGLAVSWDSEARRVSVARGASTTAPRAVPANQAPVGSVAFPYVYTDIVTYINGNRVDSYNIQGQTVVRIDDVAAAFGQIVWNSERRELRVTIDGHAPSASELTRSESMLISPNELYALMQQGHPNLVVLGINTGPNTIPGSFTLEMGFIVMSGGPYTSGTSVHNSRRPLPEMEALLSRAGITADSLVVVYTNHAQQGGRLVWELSVLGLDVLYLNGGIAGWIGAGLPTGPATDMMFAPEISDFKATNYRNDEMNIGIAGVLHALQNPDEWVIIDVRPPLEWQGIAGACPDGITGRIAGSVNIEWINAAVPGTANLQIKTEAEIREIFAPAFEGRNVVLYCRGGPRGGYVWMVLNSLGVNAYVFCGAWVEWAYAINPANNHPDRATVIRFTEELFTDGEPGCGGCGGVSACGMMDETETGAITTPSGTAVTTVLIVRDICCMSCGGDVITAIRTVDGVFQVSVDLAEDSVTVVHCSYTNVYDMVDAVNDNTRFTVESEDTIKLVVTVEPETAVESAATITTLLFVGMCCIRCASDVIAAVKVLDGVVQIITDLTEESVTIIHHPRLSADAIRNALVATGRDVS